MSTQLRRISWGCVIWEGGQGSQTPSKWYSGPWGKNHWEAWCGHQGRNLLCWQELEAVINNRPTVWYKRISKCIRGNHQCTSRYSRNRIISWWRHCLHSHLKWGPIRWKVDGPLTHQPKLDQVILYPSIQPPVWQDQFIWDRPQRNVHTIQDGGDNSIIWHLCSIIPQIRMFFPHSLNRWWSRMGPSECNNGQKNSVRGRITCCVNV